MKAPERCELCERKDQLLNFHHLIPQTLHSNKWFEKRYDKTFMRSNGIWICKKDCHKQIHIFIEEKEMGLNYNTIEKLLEHSKVKEYIRWVKKQK